MAYRTTAARVPIGATSSRAASPSATRISEETYETCDACSTARDLVPVIAAGTDIVEFSPTEDYRRTMDVVGANLAALANA